MPRRYARKPRRGRKGVRRSRIPRSIRPQMKNYSYTFTLTPQVITTDNVGAVVLGLPGLPTVPMIPASISTSTTLSSLPGYDWQIGCSFALSDIASSGTFTALYDAYKINKVEVELEYLSNCAFSGTALGGGSAFMPTFWMYWDQDDAATPLTLRSVLGKQGVKKWQPTSDKARFKYSMRPLPNIGTQTSSTSAAPIVAMLPKKSMWLNALDTQVPHFGYKLACTEFPQGAKVGALRINYKYYVSFRAPLICS